MKTVHFINDLFDKLSVNSVSFHKVSLNKVSFQNINCINWIPKINALKVKHLWNDTLWNEPTAPYILNEGLTNRIN